MTEGSVITFNLCMTKNYYKHLEKHSVLEDMIQNENSRKILIYFPLVLSLAALFIIGHMEPFKNEADIVETELFNDSSFLISMKAAQAQVGFWFFISLKLRIFETIFREKLNHYLSQQTIKILQFNQFDLNQIWSFITESKSVAADRFSKQYVQYLGAI